MVRRLMIVAVVFSALAGCKPSMNVQRSGLRCVGDTGVTVLLDELPEEKVAEARKDVKDIGAALLKFLETGDVAALTMSELRAELEKLVPVKYKGYFDAVLSAASTQHVDVEKIGPNNVKRVRAAILGCLEGEQRYDVADRPVEEDDGG